MRPRSCADFGNRPDVTSTEKLTFHPISRADFGLLGEWLVTPHVARWWADDPSAAAVEADYGGCVDGTEAAEVFIASLDARPVGLIQRYRLDDYPQYIEELAALMAVPATAYSVDFFLGPADVLGQGLGSRMISAFTSRLWQDDPGASCVIVPTNALNRASWRSLESAGFVRVASGDLTPDNPIDDPAHFIYRIDRPGAAVNLA